MDPSEVLAYLNQLGYRNISAQQLKDFIKDLKRLIKYDHRFGNGLGEFKTSEVSNSRQDGTQNQGLSEHQDIRDVFDFLYSQSTISSQGKKVVPQNKQITVRITRKPQKRHSHCIHVDRNTNPETVDPNYLSPKANSTPLLVETDLSNVVGKHDNPDGAQNRPLSSPNVLSAGSSAKNLKKNSSRPESSTKKGLSRNESSNQINRRDPVALFQYYQSEWKKQKFPGKENHSDLRWAIRERLLGGPPVDIPMSNKTSCRKVVCCSDPALR